VGFLVGYDRLNIGGWCRLLVFSSSPDVDYGKTNTN
jgi:hypothetical protein